MPDADTDKTKKIPASAPAAAKAGTAKPAPTAKAGRPAASGPARPGAGASAQAPNKPPVPKPPVAEKPTPAGAPLAAASAKATTAPAIDEENPLHRKLRLRPEDAGVVIAPPRDEDNPLVPLPESFLVLGQTSELRAQKGPFDYIQVFARDRAGLVGSFSLLVDKLAPGGSLWVSWLKPSSKLKGGGQPGDLNENVVRRIGLTNGLVDVNLAVLDRDWSALRLVRRKH
jgi:hypothetical protein